jgi:hypothetical protein
MFREDDYYRGLAAVEIRRRLLVVEENKSEIRNPKSEIRNPSLSSDFGFRISDFQEDPPHVILRYADGSAAVLARRVGAGEVMLVTTSADLTWNDWPLRKGMYVPFVDAALNHLLQDQGQTHNQLAGALLRWHPTEWDSVHPFILVDPDGAQTRLGTPELEKGRPVVTAPATSRAGIYRLLLDAGSSAEPTSRERKRTEGIPFAVVPDPRETDDLTCLTDEQLDERLGFKPMHWTAGADTNIPVAAERLSHEWTLWFLGAAVLVALFETVFAWLSNRPR